VTDFSDPKAPKSSRKKSSRTPATIDLKATVVDDGARQADPRPEEPIAADAGRTASEAAAEPSASVDSGVGTDSIEAGSPAQNIPVQDIPPQGASPQAAHSQDASSQDASSQDAPSQDALSPESPAPESSSPETSPPESPAGEPPPRDPPPQAPPRQSNLGGLIGSGLLGGLVGAGLVYGLQAWRPPAVQDDQRLAQLEQRVGALSRQGGSQAGAQGNVQADTRALDERIGALEAARASVDQRLQEVRSAAEQAAAQAQEALNRPAPEVPPAPQDNAALADLSNRLSALEDQVRASTQNIQNAANATQALESRIGEQQSRIAEQASRIGELQGSIAEQDRRVAEQVQRLEELTRRLAEGNDDATKAGIRVVLTDRLVDALGNGEPYADLLSALRRIEGDAAKLAPLEPFAEQGAPTAAELAQSFKPLGATILRDDRAASGDWTDRLLRMADRVVTIRPVNAPDAAGVPGLVARIDQALARGDVADAVVAWEALPEPARRLSEEWGRQAKARAEADQASRALAADALSALNRTTQ